MFQGESGNQDSEAATTEEPKTCEDVTDVIGKFGAWQWIIFGCVFYVYGVTGLPTLNVTFLAPDIPFQCSENRSDGDFHFGNVTGDQCKVNATTDCNHWAYDTSFWHNTLTQKFNLVCKQSFFISLSNSIHHFGDIFASIFLSYLSDRYGRRPVFIFAIIPGLVASVMALLAPNIYTFLVAKCLYGLSALSLVSVGFVLLMETVGPTYRGPLGLLVELSWAFFYISLPGVAWLMKDSFNVQLYTTVSYAPLLCLYFLVPESPRWLILHNRLGEAEKEMSRAAKLNKMKVEDIQATVAKLAAVIQKESGAQAERNYTILDLFKTPVLRQRAIILYIYWFVNGFVYYGISLNSEIFGGSVFLNFFLFGVVEIPAYIIVAWVVQSLGRKIPLCSTMIVAGLCCIAFILIPQNMKWLQILMTVLGKFFIASSFALAYPYTTEVFPTAVRTIALGSCSMIARISTMIAPFAKELGEVTSLNVVMTIFGALGIISGALCWFMPETKNKVLPQTLAEGEAFARSCKPKTYSTDNWTGKKESTSEVQLVSALSRSEGVDNQIWPANN